MTPWRINGPVFDSSRLMVEGAIQCDGVALAPVSMFRRELTAGALQRPFATETALGAYWLTHLEVAGSDAGDENLYRLDPPEAEEEQRRTRRSRAGSASAAE